MEKPKRMRRTLDIDDIEPCVRKDIIFDSNITPKNHEGKRQKLYCKKRYIFDNVLCSLLII